ncbi:unnamed protein product [marine sediment metagenome]|uniref:Uncharacterized protein n=1 Tax=marine sediment metagenome TaxID=412755 RepID=X1PWE0_9ZZZZ
MLPPNAIGQLLIPLELGKGGFGAVFQSLVNLSLRWFEAIMDGQGITPPFNYRLRIDKTPEFTL